MVASSLIISPMYRRNSNAIIGVCGPVMRVSGSPCPKRLPLPPPAPLHVMFLSCHSPLAL